MSSKKKSVDALSFFQRPLLGLIYWKRIKITDGIDSLSRLYEEAKNSSEKHPKPDLPAFEFTESNLQWTLLYDMARKGQITPRVMKNMKRADLYFLAGHVFPHPSLTRPLAPDSDFLSYMKNSYITQGYDVVTKLQGNAARARNELERRNFVWSTAALVIGASIAAFVGAYIGKN